MTFICLKILCIIHLDLLYGRIPCITEVYSLRIGVCKPEKRSTSFRVL